MGRMWKHLTRPVDLDTFLVVCILSLTAAAHFVPVVYLPNKVFIGWEFAYFVTAYLYQFPVAAMEYPVHVSGWLGLIGCLSNPLFWLGVVALVLSNRLSRRRAGIIATVAGVSALFCTLAFLPGANAILFPGFYLWLVSI